MARRIGILILLICIAGGLNQCFFESKSKFKGKHAKNGPADPVNAAAKTPPPPGRDLLSTLRLVTAALNDGDLSRATTLWKLVVRPSTPASVANDSSAAMFTAREEFVSAIEKAFVRLLAEFKTGEATLGEVENFVQLFEFYARVAGEPSLSERLQQAKFELVYARVKSAPSRAILRIAPAEREALLAPALASLVPDAGPIQFVLGDPLSHHETDASFAQYLVDLTLWEEPFTLQGMALRYPKRIALTLVTEKAPVCATTWDNLQSIEIELPPPPTLSADLTPEQALVSFQSFLVSEITKKLAEALPKWAPLSEMGHSSLRGKDGLLSTSESLAFYVSDLVNFEVKLREELRNAKTVEEQRALRLILAELFLEKYAAWFQKSLLFGVVKQEETSLKILEKRPFYGSYVPFATLLAETRSPAPEGAMDFIPPQEFISEVYPLLLTARVLGRSRWLATLPKMTQELAPLFWAVMAREPNANDRSRMLEMAFDSPSDPVAWWNYALNEVLPSATPELSKDVLGVMSQRITEKEVSLLISAIERSQDYWYRETLIRTLRSAMYSDPSIRAAVTTRAVSTEEEIRSALLAPFPKTPPGGKTPKQKARNVVRRAAPR